jgi:hypothetical protein
VNASSCAELCIELRPFNNPTTMKNKKLNLGSLKVTSFVTSLDKDNQQTLQGGVQAAITPGCGISFDRCPSVPLNNCAVPSYNRECPTLPLEECHVASVDRTCPTLPVSECTNVFIQG